MPCAADTNKSLYFQSVGLGIKVQKERLIFVEHLIVGMKALMMGLPSKEQYLFNRSVLYNAVFFLVYKDPHFRYYQTYREEFCIIIFFHTAASSRFNIVCELHEKDDHMAAIERELSETSVTRVIPSESPRKGERRQEVLLPRDILSVIMLWIKRMRGWRKWKLVVQLFQRLEMMMIQNQQPPKRMYLGSGK